MSKNKDSYYITEEAKERFRKYLFDERISFNAFCKRAGACRQQLERAYKGQIPITSTIREHFRKGGYDLL